MAGLKMEALAANEQDLGLTPFCWDARSVTADADYVKQFTKHTLYAL